MLHLSFNLIRAIQKLKNCKNAGHLFQSLGIHVCRMSKKYSILVDLIIEIKKQTEVEVINHHKLLWIIILSKFQPITKTTVISIERNTIKWNFSLRSKVFNHNLLILRAKPIRVLALKEIIISNGHWHKLWHQILTRIECARAENSCVREPKTLSLTRIRYAQITLQYTT